MPDSLDWDLRELRDHERTEAQRAQALQRSAQEAEARSLAALRTLGVEGAAFLARSGVPLHPARSESQRSTGKRRRLYLEEYQMHRPSYLYHYSREVPAHWDVPIDVSMISHEGYTSHRRLLLLRDGRIGDLGTIGIRQVDPPPRSAFGRLLDFLDVGSGPEWGECFVNTGFIELSSKAGKIEWKSSNYDLDRVLESFRRGLLELAHKPAHFSCEHGC